MTIENPSWESEKEEKQEKINSILQVALQENPSLEQVPREKLEEVVSEALDEISALEREARQPIEHLPETREEAEKIKAIWDFSGEGTYDEATSDESYYTTPYKEERYTWTDRKRLNRSAWLMRKLTEIIIGKEFKIEKGDESPQDELKEAIKENGPYLIYNSSEKRNEVVKDVLERTGTAIPEEKVFISGDKIINTLDQIKQFELPPDLELKPGDEIVLISHGPHLARIMRLINHYKPIPEGIIVKVFPVPTKEEYQERFTELEIRGILYNAFVSGDGSEVSYPYEF